MRILLRWWCYGFDTPDVGTAAVVVQYICNHRSRSHRTQKHFPCGATPSVSTPTTTRTYRISLQFSFTTAFAIVVVVVGVDGMFVYVRVYVCVNLCDYRYRIFVWKCWWEWFHKAKLYPFDIDGRWEVFPTVIGPRREVGSGFRRGRIIDCCWKEGWQQPMDIIHNIQPI